MPRKRGRPRKPIEAPFFTRSVVREVFSQARTDQVNTKKEMTNAFLAVREARKGARQGITWRLILLVIVVSV